MFASVKIVLGIAGAYVNTSRFRELFCLFIISLAGNFYIILCGLHVLYMTGSHITTRRVRGKGFFYIFLYRIAYIL